MYEKQEKEEMNDPNQRRLLRFLHCMQGTLCAYHTDQKPGGTSFCDCKVGADNIGNTSERGNGCPEMRWLIDFIATLTPSEYEKIVNRMKNEKKAALAKKLVYETYDEAKNGRRTW